jgi:hypothetical protein
MNRKSTYELISVVGAFILFSCWVFQQAVLEGTNAKLASITAAEDLYRIYQSHNAVFNAIITAQEDNKSAVDKIRKFQIYNYGLGLEKLAQETRTPIQTGYDLSSEKLQQYLELVQKNAREMKQDLVSKKEKFNLLFTFGYGLGSILALLGSILKLGLPEK